MNGGVERLVYREEWSAGPLLCGMVHLYDRLLRWSDLSECSAKTSD
jgi:hypothetical protein